MRLTEFHQLLSEEFGKVRGKWISHSHVLPQLGATPDELIERGVDLSAIWEELSKEFEVPEHRRWGVDYGQDE